MRLCLILLLSLTLTACIATEQRTGYQLNEEQFDKIKIGETNREEVLKLMGTPSSWPSFGGARWIYVGNNLIQRSVLDPKLDQQDVIAITFNDDGIVKDIERKNQHDAKFVSMNSRTTPTEGHNMNAIEQIIGNFGRFNRNSNLPDAAESQ